MVFFNIHKAYDSFISSGISPYSAGSQEPPNVEVREEEKEEPLFGGHKIEKKKTEKR